MKIQVLSSNLRRMKDELPAELAHTHVGKMQNALDRVLDQADGMEIEEVKRLLAAEWHAEVGSDLREPALSKYAGHLAAGQPIKLNVRVTERS